MDKWLSHPNSLKIISIVLALLLWAVVHIDPDSTPQTITSSIDTKTIEAAKIIVEGLDEDKFALTAMEPTVVRIDVQGKLTDLLAASSIDDYKVTVDVSEAKAGIQELPLTIKLPKGIQLVSMSPRTVTVQLEEIVTKSFQLQAVAEGKPAEGYVAGEPGVIVFDDNGIAVTLPKDDMERVGAVAASVNIDGADKTVSDKKAKVVVYDKDGLEMTNAVVEPATVTIEVKVTPPFRTLPVQVRLTGDLPEGISIESIKPEIEEVTVYGEQASIDALQIYDGITLDLSKVKNSGTFKLKPQLIDGIKAVDPEEIAVSVYVDPTSTRTFSGLKVNVEGLGEGLTAFIRSPQSGNYDLTVSGAGTILSKLQASQINIAANVEGLGPGMHTVPLNVSLPAYVQAEAGDGQAPSVNIEIVAETTAGTGEEEPSVETGGQPTETPAESETPANSGNNTGGGASNGNN